MMSSSSPAPMDRIQINDLTLHVPFLDGANWPSSEPTSQPVQLTLSFPYDLSKVAESDELQYSINYASICSTLTSAMSSGPFISLENLTERILDLCTRTHPEIQDVDLVIRRSKASLYCKAIGLHLSRSHSNDNPRREVFIEDLECPAIIGINPCERVQKQIVRFNVSTSRTTVKGPFDFRGLTETIYRAVEKSSFQSLEALASCVAEIALGFKGSASEVVTVRAAKPSALVLASSAEVQITRTLADYQRSPVSNNTTATSIPTLASLLSNISSDGTRDGLHKVAIALGSNLGDRFANIELALRLLEQPSLLGGLSAEEVAIVDTSFMYETEPMYVEDQPHFVNCACLIETNLEPRPLLSLLKKIETTVGRVPSIRNGPRAVDLDILTYDNEIIDTRDEKFRSGFDGLEGELVVPHPRIAEREFVLRPLNDMIPDYVLPKLNKPVSQLLNDLMANQPSVAPPMYKVLPFPSYPFTPSPSTHFPLQVPSTASHWTFHPTPHRKTYLMSTLNATPDSFSDGAEHDTIPTALSYVQESVQGGAHIIDVGGHSTRPGAAFVSPAEETRRVVDVVRAIRESSVKKDFLISVDTFRPEVAKAAILSGANCINDVYAFTGPDSYPLSTVAAAHLVEMRKVARELGVPVILMHSRGDAGQNKDYSGYKGGILEGLRVELGEKVDAVVRGRGGVRRWLVMVDPGVGFSKTVEDNLKILRDASTITSPSPLSNRRNLLEGYPQLIGASRKSFLGAILTEGDNSGGYVGRETKPRERGWATAAAVAAAVQGGVELVRVHDVMEMGDVVRIASRIWN
ncbi:hypothetical protein JAAARDRAFT_58960 [Jaapia argillacea MUCL 33604]|uniref:Pterin-binding domain-containing protein n=1 Tax=Jaapia argillacea MUCL 33604 TaxID=933084 RepID=A0A067PZI0_9AGAM|nr:hypothetical protein JAAARDRAFT_58960 [Jaapia argillacea MUCL 33604]